MVCRHGDGGAKEAHFVTTRQHRRKSADCIEQLALAIKYAGSCPGIRPRWFGIGQARGRVPCKLTPRATWPYGCEGEFDSRRCRCRTSNAGWRYWLAAARGPRPFYESPRPWHPELQQRQRRQRGAIPTRRPREVGATQRGYTATNAKPKFRAAIGVPHSAYRTGGCSKPT